MPIIHIQSLSYPGVDIFSTLTEAQLRNKLEPSKGIFIAESPKVIHVALNAGYKPLALLCEEKHIKGDAKDIIEQYQEMPVYTGDRELLSSLTGYTQAGTNDLIPLTSTKHTRQDASLIKSFIKHNVGIS